MEITEARRKVFEQYKATHERMQGNAEYEGLRFAAEIEAGSGSPSHFARNRLTLFIEIHTPML